VQKVWQAFCCERGLEGRGEKGPGPRGEEGCVDARLRNALEEKRMLGEQWCVEAVWEKRKKNETVCGRRGRRTRVCEAAWENTREKRRVCAFRGANTR